MKRARVSAAVIAAVMLCALVALPAGASGGDNALEASARASILVGTVNVQPDLDPALIDSRSSASSLGTTSLDSVAYPSFLVDAFLFLYGQQANGRSLLGMSEARSPQGPTHADATLSRAPLTKLGLPLPDLPAQLGRSVADATPDAAAGQATIATQSLGVGVLNNAISDSSVRTVSGVATGEAQQSIFGVSFGPLDIKAIRGIVSVSVGGAVPSVHAGLDVIGATVNGMPVTIDTEGVRAAIAPLQQQVDQALRSSGITVRLLDSFQQSANGHVSGSSGGVLLQFHPATADMLGVPRDVTLGILLGSATAQAQATPIAAPLPNVLPSVALGRPPTSATFFVPGVSAIGPRSSPLIERRTIIVTTRRGSATNARGAYAALVLIAFGLVFFRPLLRAASRA